MLPDPYPIAPFTTPVNATVRLPGSKSITNRALLLAALSGGETTLTGALFSEDTAIMAVALRQLGFAVHEDAARAELRVQGQGGRIPAESAELFVGLAGTAARFLTALCCLAPRGTYKLDGVPQMRKRPMQSLLDALQLLGAEIESDGGRLPLTIHAHGLRGGEVALDATESSQLLSALLMVAPLAREPVAIRLADPGYRREYVTMTLRMMEQFGQPPAQVSANGLHVSLPERALYRRSNHTYAIEPDASAASYFLALPMVTGGWIRLPGVKGPRESLQGDIAFGDVVKTHGTLTFYTGGMAARSNPASRAGEPWGHIAEEFNAISDTFLTLAAIAPLRKEVTVIRGIAHTRKQETDRIAAMATELRRLGQEVTEDHDSLTIHPRPLRPGQVIETHGDHRFAMSFGILGCYDLLANGQPWLAIRNPGVCAKTFPDFFTQLSKAREASTVAMAQPFVVIAVDGGAASGKSSTSRALSEQFNLLHVDTGSFYRAVTWKLLEAGAEPGDEAGVSEAISRLNLGTVIRGRSAVMAVGDWTPGAEIRSARVNENVSKFAALPVVRKFLLDYQRSQKDFARLHDFRGLVMEGRDIGSVIFPDADLRFFLEASPEARARRRADEGHDDQIHERDRLDKERKNSPLVCPPGAIAIDSTSLTLGEVVEEISALVREKLDGR